MGKMIKGRNVSVIIPACDRPELLDLALASVFEQSVQPLEIIVVDNGNEPVKLGKFEGRTRILRIEPRSGPARARNIGSKAAVGEYVAFLDDDDTWEADYLKHSINTLENEGADIVVGRLDVKDRKGLVKPYKMFPTETRKQRAVYFSNPGMGGQNILIRKAFFLELGGFDERMPPSEDRDLAARVLQRGGKIVPQPLAIAILYNHRGERASDNILRGNRMFITKHWRKMSCIELFKACRIFAKRYFSIKLVK